MEFIFAMLAEIKKIYGKKKFEFKKNFFHCILLSVHEKIQFIPNMFSFEWHSSISYSLVADHKSCEYVIVQIGTNFFPNTNW